MKIIAGLGNPEKKHQNTWHNAGFLALEELHQQGFDSWNQDTKRQLISSSGNLNGEKVILVKPQTYMNRSGAAIQAIANFYKVPPEDIYVIHDELDLPLGKIRISNNSSAGGNNGVQSIIDSLGSKNFTRIRIGIKTPTTNRMPADKYVLKKIGLMDKMTLNKVIKKSVVPAVSLILTEGLEKAKNKFN